jgi:hypothetical protein
MVANEKYQQHLQEIFPKLIVLLSAFFYTSPCDNAKN